MPRQKKKPDLSGNPLPSIFARKKKHQPAREIEEPLGDPSVPEPKPEVLTAHEAASLQKLIKEVANRDIEGLKLYEPLPGQDPFHRCSAAERIIRGSNRSGKTLCAAVEVSRAVTNQDPYGKWPDQGRFYCVAKDGDYIGQVIWRKLAKPGAFKIIRDLETGLWRACRPWEPSDLARSYDWKPAPPLIPKRLIKSIAWENRAEGIPRQVVLYTGWELSFYSSKAPPRAGTDIDGAWFDEEIEGLFWYPETCARLVDRNGMFIWSATPQAGTDQLYELHEEAERQANRPRPRVVETVLLIDDNPHLSQEQKEAFASKLSSDEERRVRIGGEFALSSHKVYPEFAPSIHCIEPREIPAGWTRYLAVDPGRQVCAVLFAAVPPPEDGDFIYLYDEAYILDADADKFGKTIANKSGEQQIQGMLIDRHGGRIHDTGSGLTVEDQYSAALKQHGFKDVRGGTGFVWGSDDIQGGLLAVRKWLNRREDGTVKLRVFNTLDNFLSEIKRYRYKRQGAVVTDEPVKRFNHSMDALRYLAMFDPRYVKPPEVRKERGYAVRMLEAKRDRKRLRDGDQPYIRLGPGKSKRAM